MLARNETILKWALYAAASLLWVFLQGAFFCRIEVLGVIPFVYPMLASIPATFEGSAPGTAFGIAVGVFCDLLLPAPLPCFYTLILPLTALCGGLLSQGALSAGFLCSAVTAAVTFFLTGLFHCVILSASGHPAWAIGMQTAALEALVTFPLIFPITILYRKVYQKVHEND